jgi:hypothetical protein
MPTRYSALAGGLLVSLPMLLSASPGPAQETWQRSSDPRYQQREEVYRPDPGAQRYDAPADNDPATTRPGRADGYPASRPNDPYAPRYGAPADPPKDAYSPRTSSANPPADDAYHPPRTSNEAYAPPRNPNDPYGPSPRPGYAQGTYGQQPYPPPPGPAYGQPQPYPPPQPGPAYGQPYSGPQNPGYGQPYSSPRPLPGEPYGPPPGQAYNDPPERGYGPPGPRYDDDVADGSSYSSREIMQAGHGFFGTVSKGLASVVEYAFQKQGRPNGYILGQDAGGAFVAGLRYGEGMLYTKDAGAHRVYWQGPSVGWDAGAEGSKVMVLVYNLRDPGEIYQRFGGVDGSAYLVGGVGVTFLTSNPVIVAPIRSGVGLRLGANIGYLKYTRQPTWNPF